jgi:hypothetical protein
VFEKLVFSMIDINDNSLFFLLAGRKDNTWNSVTPLTLHRIKIKEAASLF